MTQLPKRPLLIDEAAEYLGIKPKTLSNWIWKGIAPRHFKDLDNRVKFDIKDLDAFRRAHTKVRAS